MYTNRENSGHSRQSADSRRNDNRHSLSSNIDDRRGRGSSETNDNAEWLTMQTAKMKMALLDKSSKVHTNPQLITHTQLV